MADVIDETWSYSVGELLTVGAANWSGNTEPLSTSEVFHVDGSGNMFWNMSHTGVAGQSPNGYAEYNTSYDLTTNQHFTLTVPIKFSRGSTSVDYSQEMQIQVVDTNLTGAYFEVTLNAVVVAGVPNVFVQVSSTNDGSGSGSYLVEDLNGTLVLDLTAGVLTATYNASLVDTLAIAATLLTTSDAVEIVFSASSDGGDTHDPVFGFYGPLVLEADSGPPPTPTAPGTPTAASITETSATISWTAATGGTGTLTYTLEFNDGTGWEVAASTTSLSYALTGLTGGTVYGLRVFAIDSDLVEGPTALNDPAFTTLVPGSWVQGMITVHSIIPPGSSIGGINEDWTDLTGWSPTTGFTTSDNTLIVGPSTTTATMVHAAIGPFSPIVITLPLIFTLDPTMLSGGGGFLLTLVGSQGLDTGVALSVSTVPGFPAPPGRILTWALAFTYPGIVITPNGFPANEWGPVQPTNPIGGNFGALTSPTTALTLRLTIQRGTPPPGTQQLLLEQIEPTYAVLYNGASNNPPPGEELLLSPTTVGITEQTGTNFTIGLQ